MQSIKKIPTVYLCGGEVYADKEVITEFIRADGRSAAVFYSDQHAEALAVIEYFDSDEEHEKNLACIKKLVDEAEIPVFAGGKVERFEDVKKYLYTGVDRVLFLPSNKCIAGKVWTDVLKEVSERFGREKLIFCTDEEGFFHCGKKALMYTSAFFVSEGDATRVRMPEGGNVPIYAPVPEQEIIEQMTWTEELAPEQEAIEQMARTELVPELSFSDLTVNSDGLIPVIVQEYRTNQVLMLAYMNEEAYNRTFETGKMTYYSRSRKELWVKGMTSGHFQYLKELTADCDRDTLLAKVSQVGNACHTGSYSCFFEEIAKTPYRVTDPLHVLEKEYATILDRKRHPKEGSYTNYLFDKGIDKILKKVGEEAAEIIIAAKNPDPEEIKYEIADFLYHAMVLMVEKGVSWEDITKEISNR